MTVRELREALARFNDEDAQVVVGLDPREWSRINFTAPAVVDLGRTKERAFFVGVSEMPTEPGDDECSRCAELERAIEEAKDALDAAV